MHWSYPAAVRVLRVLRRKGWSCTAWDCQQTYRSAAPHSDVASLRALMAELGAHGDAIPSQSAGVSERGRQVSAWTLRKGCHNLARAVLRWERDNPDRNGRHHLTEIRDLARGACSGQAALF